MSAKKESVLGAAAGFQWKTAHIAEADESSAVTRESERWHDRAARVFGSAFRNSARAVGDAAAPPPTTDLEGEPPTSAEAPKTRFARLRDSLRPSSNAERDRQQQQEGEPQTAVEAAADRLRSSLASFSALRGSGKASPSS